jgi:signal transduction histidine kinase
MRNNQTNPKALSYDSTIHLFLSLFRFFSYILAVLLIQVIPLNTTQAPDLQLYIIIGCVGLYTLVKVFSRFHWNRENTTTYMILGGDVLVCIVLLLFTRGLDSGFLVYALVPITTAALLFDQKVTLIIATTISVSVIIAHAGLSLLNSNVIGFEWIMDGNYLPLLIVYTGFCFLISTITYRTNLNIRSRIEFAAVLEERKRMRRELHDDVAQTLSSLNLMAQMLNKSVVAGDTEGAMKATNDIQKISKDTCENIRKVIDSLSETEFQSLIPNLRNLISESAERYGIEVVLDLPSKLSKTTSLSNIQLLYITNEALTNTRKHAGATKIWLRLENTPHGVKMTAKDNGKGFDMEEHLKSGVGHHGLNIMKERAEAVGGAFSIDTSPDTGTEVSVELPGEKVRL